MVLPSQLSLVASKRAPAGSSSGAVGMPLIGAAMTGSEAVRIAERERPDIALVDIGLLGGMDGWTVARKLYERVGYATLLRVGLIPYPAFRAELERLSASGLAERDTAANGSTLWRLASGSSAPGDAE